jgi:hypothetical protein
MGDGITERLGALRRSGAFDLTTPAVALLVLNLLDGLFTTVYLHLGVAEEANPLMRMAWEVSPLTFMVSKLAVVSVGLGVLCLYRETKLAAAALKIAVGIYTVLLVWHLAFLAHLVVG